jgi:hypothetical protein
MPVMEQKPGRYWGVIGRQHLPLGKREDREVTTSAPAAKKGIEPSRFGSGARIGNQRLEARSRTSQFQHFSVSAFALPLLSDDFTAKLFCNVELWLERLPKLICPCEGLSKGARLARPGEGLIVSCG